MRFLIFILIAITGSTAEAQNRNISGTIVDEGDGALAGAYICWVKDTLAFKNKESYSSKYIDLSAQDGKFNIIIPEKRLQKHPFIGVSAFGFLPQIINIQKSKTLDIRVKMQCQKNAVDSLRKMIVAKPAIYLYPEQETSIHVSLEFKGQLKTTYPEYHNGWNVRAGPDGSLYNFRDKRIYEYLFWDGIYTFPEQHFHFKDGFVVAQSETAFFLRQKLTYLGLINKEINDFIVYWLPVLNQNERNFIHFRVNDDIDHCSVLRISPEPDSWIRVFKEFKAVDKDFSIPEQHLTAYPRNKFTLVEWGGGKIESPIKIE